MTVKPPLMLSLRGVCPGGRVIHALGVPGAPPLIAIRVDEMTAQKCARTIREAHAAWETLARQRSGAVRIPHSDPHGRWPPRRMRIGHARPSSAFLGAREPVIQTDAGTFPAPRTVCCEHDFQHR